LNDQEVAEIDDFYLRRLRTQERAAVLRRLAPSIVAAPMEPRQGRERASEHCLLNPAVLKDGAGFGNPQL